ncbi:AAA family ATPase [candidate division KSB1 bacterium]|nr:AAA family ATPase [candidate division KSB1 bacterium]
MFIKKLSVEKFKSFKNKTEIELRGLTILSGANSSGKSSIMQPILLLKQTLHIGYDPGPILISGPNVIFSETDQMLWNAPGEFKTDSFMVGMEVLNANSEVAVELIFKKQKGGPTPFKIDECVWIINNKRIPLRERMKPQDINSIGTLIGEGLNQLKNSLTEFFQSEKIKIEDMKYKRGGDKFIVKRSNFLLAIYLELLSINFPILPDTMRDGVLQNTIRKVIHVPGLRGNPRRTYPVTAVEDEFPGLFQDYVASIIASWQKSDEDLLESLGENLFKLGLTWKVQAKQKSDTEVELVVGRLYNEKKTGISDMVSIADVGFGVSQSLPVIVALLTVLPGQLVYIEQPEIHLHPRAQVALAELIADAVDHGAQVVIETHSELLLLGIQKLVAQGKIKKDNVLLHWFERDNHGVSKVTTVEFDEQGAPGKAPIDFSDVSMNAMREYLDATVTSKR